MHLLLQPFAVGPNVVTFVGKVGIDTPYLYFACRGAVISREYKRHWGSLTSSVILLPPPEAVTRFTEVVVNAWLLRDLLAESNSKLIQMRDHVLEKLIA